MSKEKNGTKESKLHCLKGKILESVSYDSETRTVVLKAEGERVELTFPEGVDRIMAEQWIRLIGEKLTFASGGEING